MGFSSGNTGPCPKYLIFVTHKHEIQKCGNSLSRRVFKGDEKSLPGWRMCEKLCSYNY